jgi:hypothetical protein
MPRNTGNSPGRRGTPIETNNLSAFHLRLSAAYMPFSASARGSELPIAPWQALAPNLIFSAAPVSVLV